FGQINGDGVIVKSNGYYIAGNFFGGALDQSPTGAYLRLGGTGTVQGNTFRTNFTGITAEGSAAISGNIFFARLPLQILASQAVVSGNGNSYYGLNSPNMAVDIAPDHAGTATVDLGPDYIQPSFAISYNVSLPPTSGRIRGVAGDMSKSGPALSGGLVSLERLDPATRTVDNATKTLTLRHRDSGSIIDNAGATGPATVTLPAPSHGLSYTFQIR